MWGPPEARDSRWLRSTKVPRRLEGPRPARCRRGARTDRDAPDHGTAATAGSAGLADHAGSECASTVIPQACRPGAAHETFRGRGHLRAWGCCSSSSQETLEEEKQKASVKVAAPQRTSRLQARNNNGLPEANDDREGSVTGKASGPAGHHRDRPPVDRQHGRTESNPDHDGAEVGGGSGSGPPIAEHGRGRPAAPRGRGQAETGSGNGEVAIPEGEIVRNPVRRAVCPRRFSDQWRVTIIREPTAPMLRRTDRRGGAGSTSCRRSHGSKTQQRGPS